MASLLKIGSLWKNTDKNGNEMLSGKLSTPVPVTLTDEHRLVILTNNRKEADNHPDFEVFVSKDEPQN